MVCAEHTTASEIILDASDVELQGDVGHVESHVGPFGESAGVGATIGSEIVLEAPGGTPR
jgi:hypothetical protein